MSGLETAPMKKSAAPVSRQFGSTMSNGATKTHSMASAAPYMAGAQSKNKPSTSKHSSFGNSSNPNNSSHSNTQKRRINSKPVVVCEEPMISTPSN